MLERVGRLYLYVVAKKKSKGRVERSRETDRGPYGSAV